MNDKYFVKMDVQKDSENLLIKLQKFGISAMFITSGIKFIAGIIGFLIVIVGLIFYVLIKSYEKPEIKNEPAFITNTENETTDKNNYPDFYREVHENE